MNKPRIEAYFHCKKCLNGRLAVGWTKEGFQVYCEKCNKSVIDIDFRGQKVKQVKDNNHNPEEVNHCGQVERLQSKTSSGVDSLNDANCEVEE